MDEALRSLAKNLLDAAPTSVEMPAGAGKTHLLAAAVAVAAETGQRSLVLTHTNAGVDTIRRRLRNFGVTSKQVRVETITSWAFSLAQAYPSIGGVTISELPDWSLSDEYVEAATRIASSRVISHMHRVSFDYLFIDEYQDCTLTHHSFIEAICKVIPRTIILGDQLQAIFGFAGELTDWSTHVLPRYPEFTIQTTPYRWVGHNEPLGQWLLDIRSTLLDGAELDLSSYSVPGLNYVQDLGQTTVAMIAHGFDDNNETVVLLDKWPNSVAIHASRLAGRYTVMEDINGNFMRMYINGLQDRSHNVMALPLPGDPRLACWFALFAKACIIGLSSLDRALLTKLSNNESVSALSRADIQPVVAALEALRLKPTYEQIALTAEAFRSHKSLRIYRWEAWSDTLRAIAMCTENEEPAIDNLARVRERLRRQGRKTHSRIASRTLLVKGLEYDHIVIADLSGFRDPRNLYVALSRARKSVTIIGHSAKILLANEH